MLKLRKLDTSENFRTRQLWEEVFAEDTKAFLDYYYFLKTRENEIFVLEDDEIQSMIHLNPYTVKMGNDTQTLHYIVAVATRETHRKQGYMRTLLCHCMEGMFKRKEPFTFLMPAAEAIYTPYDFRIVYMQNQMQFHVKDLQMDIDDSEATLSDVSAMAEFYQENFASLDRVAVWKDESYFQNKLFEQQSELGGIRIIRQESNIVCMYAYGNEEGLEVYEPYILQGFFSSFGQSLYQLSQKKECSIPVLGFHADEEMFNTQNPSFAQKPLIMARIIHLPTFLEQLRTKNGAAINCSFAVIDLYLQNNSGIWNLRSSEEENGKIIVSEAEDSEGVFAIAVLTQFLFGMISIEELEQEKGVILNEHLKKELHKIELLEPVFINEVV